MKFKTNKPKKFKLFFQKHKMFYKIIALSLLLYCFTKYQDVFAEISQNRTISLIKTTIQS